MGVNRLIEPDTNPLVHFCASGEIMLIMGEHFVNFRVSFLCTAGSDVDENSSVKL